MNTIAENFAKFRSELTEVCVKNGRNPSEITLVAVTKTHSPTEINELISAGVTIIGENRIQEALEKFGKLKKCERHFIGHLQSNKARDAVMNFTCVESIDSIKLARKLNTEVTNLASATSSKLTHLPVFLQVNISREPQKSGFLEEGLEKTVEEIRKLSNLTIEGLMTIGVFGNAKKTRDIFQHGFALTQKFGFKKFSAGMSGDWQIAVKYGATHLRIGRILFE